MLITEKILNIYETKNIFINRNWLNEINKIIQERQLNYNEDSLVEFIFEQAMINDITISFDIDKYARMYPFPKDVIKMPKGKLKGYHIVQILWAKDIGRSGYSQTHKDDYFFAKENQFCEEEEDDIKKMKEANKNYFPTSRIFLFSLTDGFQIFKAFEYNPIYIDNNFEPGSKAVLHGEIDIRFGNILIKPKNFIFIGGIVNQICSDINTNTNKTNFNTHLLTTYSNFVDFSNNEDVNNLFKTNKKLKISLNKTPIQKTYLNNADSLPINPAISFSQNKKDENTGTFILKNTNSFKKSFQNAMLVNDNRQSIAPPNSNQNKTLDLSPEEYDIDEINMNKSQSDSSHHQIFLDDTSFQLPNILQPNFGDEEDICVYCHSQNTDTDICNDRNNFNIIKVINKNEVKKASRTSNINNKVDNKILNNPSNDVFDNENFKSNDILSLTEYDLMKQMHQKKIDIHISQSPPSISTKIHNSLKEVLPAKKIHSLKRLSEPSLKESAKIEDSQKFGNAISYNIRYLFDVKHWLSRDSINSVLLEDYTIKGFIHTLLSKLERTEAKCWALKVKITDGTGILDVNISNDVLTQISGISCADFEELSVQAAKDSILKLKKNQIITNFQRKLINLSGIFHLAKCLKLLHHHPASTDKFININDANHNFPILYKYEPINLLHTKHMYEKLKECH
ncbi:recQ-mediated genome instability protein 1-like isoform X3 [Gordionus sp. m RMFG-2023]|uniref:recQ-mediated genome instability protein 1-like isoform X3 n=1 Tax=Gordionus sp. m RMFG-2023 TaxID=3053472 RepID=UPI0031FCEABC